MTFECCTNCGCNAKRTKRSVKYIYIYIYICIYIYIVCKILTCVLYFVHMCVCHVFGAGDARGDLEQCKIMGCEMANGMDLYLMNGSCLKSSHTTDIAMLEPIFHFHTT